MGKAIVRTRVMMRHRVSSPLFWISRAAFISRPTSDRQNCPGAFSLIRNSPLQVSDDSDGVHKCDHTGGVDTTHLDDRIDQTFVSTGDGETLCPSFRVPLRN